MDEQWFPIKGQRVWLVFDGELVASSDGRDYEDGQHAIDVYEIGDAGHYLLQVEHREPGDFYTRYTSVEVPCDTLGQVAETLRAFDLLPRGSAWDAQVSEVLEKLGVGGNFDTDEETPMMSKWGVRRLGNTSFVLPADADRVAYSSGQNINGRTRREWSDISVYCMDLGLLILHVEYHTRGDDHSRGYVILRDFPREVAEILTSDDYDWLPRIGPWKTQVSHVLAKLGAGK